MKVPEITITRTFVVSNEEMEEARLRLAAAWPLIEPIIMRRIRWETERLYGSVGQPPTNTASDGRIRLLYGGCG